MGNNKTTTKKETRPMNRYETFSAEFNGIELDYQLIGNVEEYVDVDIYVTLLTKEQYLVRVYKNTGEEGFVSPFYRYAPDKKESFSDDEVEPPAEVANAVGSIIPHIHEIILTEEADRLAK
jgi:hypothetical protein